MSKLHISDDLMLPLDAATQTFAFIGRKGSGKTYGAGKLTELLIDQGVQVVILDSVGNWYGLRNGADGKESGGLDVPIIGGLRGDIVLEASGGALIADVIVDSGRSIVVDVSQFNKADRQRFAYAFGERLWQRKKAEREPTPVHLVIEESQLIVPEQVKGDTAKMVGIFEEIIRLGRNYGIGVSMITQRPQSVNKEVLNQTECLMVFQVNGAHERKALKEWIVHQGMDVSLLNELPTLKPGNCYVWSPQWLEVLRRIHIAPKRTFDSTSTPRSGHVSRGRRELRPIDLEALRTKMAATIERAKADDPRELRNRIAALKRDLQQAQQAKPAAEVKTVEVSVITDKQIEQLETLINEMGRIMEKLDGVSGGLSFHCAAATGGLRTALERFVKKKTVAVTACPIPARPETQRAVAQMAAHVASSNGAGDLTGPERKILTALAQHGERAMKVLAGLTGYVHSGGAFRNPLSALRSKGYAEGRDIIRITPAGLAALGQWEPLPTRQELREYWLTRLKGPERKLLTAILEAYPKTISVDALAAATDYEVTGGAFRNPLSRLRSFGLVHGRQEVRASDELFE